MFLWVLEQVNISRRKFWFWERYLTWDTVYLIRASDRRAFLSIFLSFVLCFCLLKEEGSSFMEFYLYPTVVIDSGWLPVSSAVCSCLDLYLYLSGTSEGCLTCDFRLVEMEWGQLVFHKLFCCRMMFWANYFRGQMPFCSVSTPGSHWSFHHTDILPPAEKT